MLQRSFSISFHGNFNCRDHLKMFRTLIYHVHNLDCVECENVNSSVNSKLQIKFSGEESALHSTAPKKKEIVIRWYGISDIFTFLNGLNTFIRFKHHRTKLYIPYICVRLFGVPMCENIKWMWNALTTITVWQRKTQCMRKPRRKLNTVEYREPCGVDMMISGLMTLKSRDRSDVLQNLL